jgi:signal transduction histidine kinase
MKIQVETVTQKRIPASSKAEACPPELSLALSKAIARLFSAPDLTGLQSLLPAVLVEMLQAQSANLGVQKGDQLQVLASTDKKRVGTSLKASEDATTLVLPLAVDGHPPMSVSVHREAPFGTMERDLSQAIVEAVPGFWTRLEQEKQLSHQVEAHQAELRQSEFKQEQLREQLVQNERLKAEFVATMSHELRTPLNVVLGFGSLLADEAFGELNPQQGEACQKILESSERLAILINDLLDFSRLQAHTLDFQFASLDVPELLQEIMDDIVPLAEKKGLEASLDVAADLPRLRADPDRLRQTLKHLLDNALKFTPSGGKIGVRAWFEAEDGFLRIDVWDTGIGIPNESMHRLFDRFYQVDSSNTRLYGGTGIGLALVKELVERHGGQVMVDSKVGKGSNFQIWLPIQGPPEEQTSPHGARRWTAK